MTAFFVISPSKDPEVASLQNDIKHQFGIAWQQTLGDAAYFDTLGQIYEGVTAFYDQSSQAYISLISQPDSDQALYYVFHSTYEEFARIFSKEPKALATENIDLNLSLPGKFMTEQALNNIVPETIEPVKVSAGLVAGAGVESAEPVNQTNSWVTLRDNFTGQLYCLAIYNGEINKYLGACKNDYR